MKKLLITTLVTAVCATSAFADAPKGSQATPAMNPQAPAANAQSNANRPASTSTAANAATNAQMPAGMNANDPGSIQSN